MTCCFPFIPQAPTGSIHHQPTSSSSTFYSTVSSPASPTPTPSLLPFTPPRQIRPLNRKVTDDPFLLTSSVSPVSTPRATSSLTRGNSLFDTSKSRYRASSDLSLSGNDRTPRKSTQQQANDVIPSSSTFDKSKSSRHDALVVDNWKPRGVGTSMFAFPDRDAATIECLKRERAYGREGPGMSFVANV